MSEVVRTFVCAEARHEEADSAAKAPLRALGGFAQIGLELAEGHLDRIEIGRVLGQISQICTDGLDRFLDPGDLVGPEIVHHDDIAAGERGGQALLDVGEKGFAVHGAVDHQRCRHFVAAQASHERQRLPGSKRHAPDQSLATRASTVKTSHGRVHRGFVNEDKAGRIK